VTLFVLALHYHVQWRNWRFEPGGAKRSWRGPTDHYRGLTSQNPQTKL